MSAAGECVQQVALVTGASAGIGAQIAVLLANKGITVVGLARRSELIEVLGIAYTYIYYLWAKQKKFNKTRERKLTISVQH